MDSCWCWLRLSLRGGADEVDRSACIAYVLLAVLIIVLTEILLLRPERPEVSDYGDSGWGDSDWGDTDCGGWPSMVHPQSGPAVTWLLPPCRGAGFKVMLDRDYNLTLLDVALVEPRVSTPALPGGSASTDLGGEVVGFIRVDQVEHPTFEPLVLLRAEESGSDCSPELVEEQRELLPRVEDAVDLSLLLQSAPSSGCYSELLEEQRELKDAPPGSQEHSAELVALDAVQVGRLIDCVAHGFGKEAAKSVELRRGWGDRHRDDACGVEEPCLKSRKKAR